jgi:PAS domain S-box-containing protein
VSPAAATELGYDDALGLLNCQTAVLELTANGAALGVVLDLLTGSLERLMPGSRCSVLLLEPSSGSLRHGSAPSISPDYLAAIDGLAPGPDEGSCGTAAYLSVPVVARDIDADPRWVAYREVAHAAGLRACWSTPILGDSAVVLGTFAVYHTEPHQPTPREERIVEQLTYLTSVAIEHAALYGALTVSEERFRRAFEDNAVAMALLDTEGRCTQVNDALERLVGRTAATLGATPLADLVVPDEQAALVESLDAVRTGRLRSALNENRMTVPGADPRVVSMTISLVRGAQGEPVQLSVNMLDVTERHLAAAERQARAEAELARRAAEQASNAKSAFLSAVSHEMRTPLQAIMGFAEVLRTLDLDTERSNQALGLITDGVTHLLELVDDTLDLARIEADALPLNPQRIEAVDAVADAVDFLAPVADKHGVVLVRDAAAGQVWADARRLRQVLINLISNGIRYSGPQGVVRVAARPHGSRVEITVADNGPGIPAEVRARLFEPFARPAQDDGSEGVGLGLMLARGLTEAMHGTLDLLSPAAGGTVASVVLPSRDVQG